MRYSTLAQARLKAKCWYGAWWGTTDFANISSVARVWAAFFNCNFEVGERSEVGALEGSDFFWHTQAKHTLFSQQIDFIYPIPQKQAHVGAHRGYWWKLSF